jgi:hypothetical protein
MGSKTLVEGFQTNVLYCTVMHCDGIKLGYILFGLGADVTGRDSRKQLE